MTNNLFQYARQPQHQIVKGKENDANGQTFCSAGNLGISAASTS
jgi:hypothetical protein